MKRNIFIVSLLLCSALVCLTAKLAVLSPQSVASKFDREEGVDFRVIQFGQTHFGAHFVGNLVLANPLDACGPIRPFRKGEGNGRENLIAVVMSGGCQDSIKIRNVEQSGAKMVLLINDNERLPQEHGSRQGYQNFNIPLVLIPREDGDKLLEYMQRNTDPNSERIFVTLNFPKDLKKKTVNLDLWFSVSDKQGIHKFLDHLKEIIEDFGDSFVFTPHYVTWTCATCRLQGYTKSDNPDCVSGGRYCSPDPDKEGPLTGKDVVLEDLRQMCIWKVSKSLWWSYMTMFEETCRNEPNMRQCGTEILGAITILMQSQEVTRCIESSWVKDSTKSGVSIEALNDNTLLKQEKELQTQFDVTSFPMLYINYKPYEGKLGKVYKVYREICKELDSEIPVCQKIRESHHRHHRHSIWSYIKDILIVVLVIALLGSVVLMCYRRVGKREYKQLSMEANNMVSNYFAMEDKEELQT